MAAARLERAALGRRERGWNLAFENDVALLHRRVGDRNRREQRLGIGMERRREDLRRRPHLDDMAEIHDDGPVGEIAHHREVVADEDHGRLRFALQIHQKLADRGLNRDIERGHRLVGDDHARAPGEGARNADALLLSPRQLPWATVRECPRQLHQVEKPEHGVAPLGVVRPDAEPLQRTNDLRPDRIARVQRVERILKDHLDRGNRLGRPPFDRPALDRFVIEHNQTLGRRLEPEQHFGERRLAAARFADNRQNFGFLRGEGDILHRLDRARFPAAEDRARCDPIVLLEPVDFEDVGADLDRLEEVRFLGHGRPVDRLDPEAPAHVPHAFGDFAHRHVRLIADAREEIAATRTEIAPLRSLIRQRQLAGNGNERIIVLVGARQRHRAKEALRIGVAHGAEHVADPARLDRLARIHHGDGIAGLENEPEIVRNEER